MAPGFDVSLTAFAAWPISCVLFILQQLGFFILATSGTFIILWFLEDFFKSFEKQILQKIKVSIFFEKIFFKLKAYFAIAIHENSILLTFSSYFCKLPKHPLQVDFKIPGSSKISMKKQLNWIFVFDEP